MTSVGCFEDMRIECAAFIAFPPFADGRISFPEAKESDSGLAEVQLITGENGSGKTRLLSALAAACGNATDLNARHAPIDQTHQLVVAMSRDGKKAAYVRSANQILIFESSADAEEIVDSLKTLNRHEPSVITKDGAITYLSVSARASNLSDWKSESKVAAQAYRGTGRVGDHQIVAMQPIAPSDPAKDLSFERPQTDDALVCQSMANLKLSAAMEFQSGEPRDNCRSIKITERFEAAISKVTGRSFSFQVARHPDLHLEVRWGGASMKLAVLPDGLRSIIAWLIACIAKLESQFPEDPNPLDIPLILLLDEPESHLHPAWQRQLIPAAQQLFPNAQIFAVTHSPFVISSVNSGWIHVLRMNEEGLVTADEPIECSKGDSYLDAVEDVLGLTQWYDPETEMLLAEFRALKKKLVSKNGSLEELETKASVIGERSESLKSMMARELHQIRRNLPEDVVAQ